MMYNLFSFAAQKLFTIWNLTLLLIFIVGFPVSSATAQTTSTQTFSNTTPITLGNISELSGIADPYPSSIAVNGVSGIITDVNVRINGLSPSNPNDFAFLLVAPNGQTRMVIQSDVGGYFSSGNITYTLDDQAKIAIPPRLEAGTFRPTSIGNDDVFPQVGSNPPPSDCRPTANYPTLCPQAAPAGTATLNGTFGGVSPNGEWKLYVIDCCAPYSGSISGGWSLIITTADNSSTVQVLTLDAGDGIKAELSNYSLTNYSQTNGVYRGSFCFTLKNTSQRSPTKLPIFITALGYEYSGSDYNSLHKTINYSVEGSFKGGGPLGVAVSDGFPGGYVYLSSDSSKFPYNYPHNGIPPGGSASFCFLLEKNSPFTLSELVNEFAIVFNDGVPTIRSVFGQNGNTAHLFVDNLDTNQMCFSIANCGPQGITGIGFDLPGNPGLFTSIASTPPLPDYVNFRFTISPFRLRYLNGGKSGRADFGFLTGQLFPKGLPQFGIPRPNGENSNTGNHFCVSGNFSGLSPTDVANSIIVRFENDWGTTSNSINNNECIVVFQPGIRGVVASNPR